MIDAMLREGCHQVAEVAWQFPVKIFWHKGERIQVSVIDSNPYLLKASKSYRLKSITPEGQQFSRDLPSLQDYLESHFPEMHISVSTFRDKTPSMIFRELGVKGLDSDAAKRLADTQELRNLAGDDRMINELLADEIEQLKKGVEEQATIKKLAREYDKKAVSVAYVFSYSSNLQATRRENFTDTLLSVIREVRNYHRYEVMQKLQGGKLQIYVEEVTHPDLAFQIEWAGGVLNPKQLEKLGPEFDELRKKVEEYLTVFPTSDIEGAEEKKLFGAKAIQNFLSRVKRVEQTPDIPNLPREGGWIGNVIQGDKTTSVPLLLPFKPRHIYVSGSTQYGKTYLARVLAENALIEGINVLILDPTRQWCGLGLPNREFKRFDELGIDRKHARGFPIELSDGLEGCNVVSMKGMTESERLKAAKTALQKVYDSMDRETDDVKLMVFLEEAHLFLDDEVSNLAMGIGREKAKYGVVLVPITQSLTDFRMKFKIIRELVTVRGFLRATDRAEHEYIERYVSKEAVEVIKNLKQGEAVIHSPDFPWTKFYVRPPFSSVREPSDEEIQEIRRCKMETQTGLSEKEEQALRIIKDYHKFNDGAILASAIASKMKLSGRSRTNIFNSLVKKRLIRKVRIKLERGRPADGFIPFN
jgi:hypothetical protein